MLKLTNSLNNNLNFRIVLDHIMYLETPANFVCQLASSEYIFLFAICSILELGGVIEDFHCPAGPREFCFHSITCIITEGQNVKMSSIEPSILGEH